MPEANGVVCHISVNGQHCKEYPVTNSNEWVSAAEAAQDNTTTRYINLEDGDKFSISHMLSNDFDFLESNAITMVLSIDDVLIDDEIIHDDADRECFFSYSEAIYKVDGKWFSKCFVVAKPVLQITDIAGTRDEDAVETETDTSSIEKSSESASSTSSGRSEALGTLRINFHRVRAVPAEPSEMNGMEDPSSQLNCARRTKFNNRGFANSLAGLADAGPDTAPTFFNTERLGSIANFVFRWRARGIDDTLPC